MARMDTRPDTDKWTYAQLDEYTDWLVRGEKARQAGMGEPLMTRPIRPSAWGYHDGYYGIDESAT